MDVEKMSNEELANEMAGLDVDPARWEWKDESQNEYYNRLNSAFEEAESRLRTGMNWLPMTPDAVFEDGGLYLLCAHGCYTVGSWSKMDGQFVDEDFYHHYVSKFSHYARITEPK